MNYRITVAGGLAALLLTVGLGTGLGIWANGSEPPQTDTVPLIGLKRAEKKPVELPEKPSDLTALGVLGLKKPHDAMGNVVVHSTVKAVATHSPDVGLILVSTAKLPNNDYFGVVLTQKVQADLKRLGIADIEKHFAGTALAVEGKLQSTLYLTFPAHEMVFIKVESLDQIRSVTRGEVKE